MDLFAIGIFASYFLFIIALFVLLFGNLKLLWSTASTNARKHASIFLALALASFAHTWFYMFKFMHSSFLPYKNLDQPLIDRISNWLANTRLFEQAWYAVCFPTNANWWWSEQLCLFTVGSWTLFLAAQGETHKIKHVWAYMLLGQLVAISVASNLFYAALALAPRQQESLRYASPTLWLSALLSLASVAALPLTSERGFLANLLLMHVLIVLPLFGTVRTTRPAYGMRIKQVYLISNLICTYLRVRSNFRLEEKSFHFLWTLLHSHPAQSSIRWDVIWTSLSFVCWYMDSVRSSAARLFSVATIPVLSVGVAAPYIWAQEYE